MANQITSPRHNDEIQTNATPKLPLFMGGSHGNALGQITFTFDEWQALSNAIDEYAPFDYTGVYHGINDRVTTETDTESYSLNLYCCEQIDIEILKFISRAVIHYTHQSESLNAKLSKAIIEQVEFWLFNFLSETANYESVTIESNSLSYSLEMLKKFSHLAIKGGN